MTDHKKMTEDEKVKSVEEFAAEITMSIEKKLMEIFEERRAFVVAINIVNDENPKTMIASNLQGENLVIMGIQISDTARQSIEPEKPKKAPVILMPNRGIITKH